jgi:hypothetical protein
MQFNSHQVLRLPVETHFTAQNKNLLQTRINEKFPDAQCESIGVNVGVAVQAPKAEDKFSMTYEQASSLHQ